jgi:hypothetical protein
MGFITRKLKKSKKWKSMYFAFQKAKSRLFLFDNKDAVKPKGRPPARLALILPALPEAAADVSQRGGRSALPRYH